MSKKFSILNFSICSNDSFRILEGVWKGTGQRKLIGFEDLQLFPRLFWKKSTKQIVGERSARVILPCDAFCNCLR